MVGGWYKLLGEGYYKLWGEDVTNYGGDNGTNYWGNMVKVCREGGTSNGGEG